MNENLIKQTCKELGLTQKELAERLGVKEVTINKWSSSGEVPTSGLKSIELLRENEKLKKQLSIVESFKSYIKDS